MLKNKYKYCFGRAVFQTPEKILCHFFNSAFAIVKSLFILKKSPSSKVKYFTIHKCLAYSLFHASLFIIFKSCTIFHTCSPLILITKVQPPPPQPVDAPVMSQNTSAMCAVPLNTTYLPSGKFLKRSKNTTVQ